MGNTEQTKKKIKITPRLLTILAVVVLLTIYLAVPAVHQTINSAVAVVGSADVEILAEYIRSFGAYAVVFSFFLMILSCILAPLPAFMIALANAAIFGWWQGAILSWVSSMTGAFLCFYFSRIMGRDIVEKFAGRGALASVEGYFEKYGTKTVLICRLLPFVSFDAVSYFAGLTPLSFWPFFIATGIGQLPATIIYSYVGGMLTGGTKYLVTALLCIFSASILISIIKQAYTDRQNKSNSEKESENE